VLRIAIAELIGRPGTPVRVVLDEAIEIARRYGGDESGRFVNGVLAAYDPDQVAARTGGRVGNRGAEVALAAVQMAALRRRMEAR
jgi:6,7-dimethyl-8-ribityllumazine synthase